MGSMKDLHINIQNTSAYLANRYNIQNEEVIYETLCKYALKLNRVKIWITDKEKERDFDNGKINIVFYIDGNYITDVKVIENGSKICNH